MSNVNVLSKSLLAVGLIGLASTASAQPPEMGFYLGAGYGSYKYQFDNDDLDTNFDDDSDVVKAFAGLNFNPAIGNYNPSLALEVTYLNFGDAEDEGLTASLEGMSLAGIIAAPLNRHVTLFGKLGWFAWETDVEGTLIGDIIVDEEADGDDIFYGIGVKLALTEVVDLRLEYDRYEIDDAIDPDLDIVSLSAQYTF